MSQRLGVAISTTGEPHRMDLLRQCVRHWDAALPLGASLFVTVDGSRAEVERAAHAVDEWTSAVFRVGQFTDVNVVNRLGVAVNKNTGLELLVDNALCNQMFLCDDDTWPRNEHAIEAHTELGLAHSMVCWGRHRKPMISSNRRYATWAWPRGVLLYVEDPVLDVVGGMVERFGPGGHEHVEWSKRIHNAGWSPADFPTPASYINHGGTGAVSLWHAEDMARPREPLGLFRARRRRLTTIRHEDGDWDKINAVMTEMEGRADYVPFRAAENGRASATISSSSA